MVIGHDGYPMIGHSVMGSDNGALQVSRCTDYECTTIESHIIKEFPGSASGFDQYSLAGTVGADGNPVWIYDENIPRSAVSVCNEPTCSTPASYRRIALYARSPSISIGADGFPIMVYRNDDVPTTEIRHCFDTTCGSSNHTSHRDSRVINMSVAVGIDGLAVFAAADGTFLRCSDVACTTVISVPITDDTTPGFHPTFTDTAIAVGADGLPIAAFRTTSGEIRVVACGTLSCSPYFKVGRP